MKIIPATADDLERISAAALADSHPAFAPTHFAVNEAGEIRGYFSAGKVQAVMFWSHKKNTPHASLKIVAAAQKAACQLPGLQLWPCSPASPFAPQMERMGFNRLGNADFFILKHD